MHTLQKTWQLAMYFWQGCMSLMSYLFCFPGSNAATESTGAASNNLLPIWTLALRTSVSSMQLGYH